MSSDHWIDVLEYIAPKPTEERVIWTIDWGSKNDVSCAMIIKGYPDGLREVVAMEYSPYHKWTNLSNYAVEGLVKRCLRPETLIIETQRLLKARNGH